MPEPTSKTYTDDKEEIVIESILYFDELKKNSLKYNMESSRLALNLTSNQKYMMSLVWLILTELHLLDAFPGVIIVDTAEKGSMRIDIL